MSRRILILRRENIGDLVCTTPLIAALRKRFPDAFLAVLANSYNAPILAGHADLNAVYSYTKGKHAGSPLAAGRAHLQRIGLLLRLRNAGFDDIVLADPTYVVRNVRLARWLRGGRAGSRILGFAAADGHGKGLDLSFPANPLAGECIVEVIFRLAAAWDIGGKPPPLQIHGRSGLAVGNKLDAPLGLHISARRPSQRWPAERFAELARVLHERHGARILLFWSPGAGDDAKHPGDDRKAEQVMALAAGVPIQAVPTDTLEKLVDGIEACRLFICADGGAMHIAAGLGKPIVCLFGDSDADLWRPWGVPFRLLQPASHNVDDITVGKVADAYASLLDDSSVRFANR